MQFNNNWTLFLDRDGVINERLPGRYVQYWEDFKFTEKALEAFKIFNHIFGRIVIVTNQQGIGKGLMSEKDLALIHEKMELEINKKDACLDGIYYCPDLASLENNYRKPNPAMAFQAQKDFPKINFQKSIMVGDSISDMQFGEALGMICVFIETNPEEVQKSKNLTFAGRYPKLYNFAENLKN